MYVYDLCKEVADTYDLTSEIFDPLPLISSPRLRAAGSTLAQYELLNIHNLTIQPILWWRGLLMTMHTMVFLLYHQTLIRLRTWGEGWWLHTFKITFAVAWVLVWMPWPIGLVLSVRRVNKKVSKQIGPVIAHQSSSMMSWMSLGEGSKLLPFVLAGYHKNPLAGNWILRFRCENLTWTPIKSLQALVCSVLPSYWDIGSDVRGDSFTKGSNFQKIICRSGWESPLWP